MSHGDECSLHELLNIQLQISICLEEPKHTTWKVWILRAFSSKEARRGKLLRGCHETFTGKGHLSAASRASR